MARDRVISVRMTEADYARLSALGPISEVIRNFIAEKFAPPLPVVERTGRTRSYFSIAWDDGRVEGDPWIHVGWT